jgi:hypothetical protein
MDERWNGLIGDDVGTCSTSGGDSSSALNSTNDHLDFVEQHSSGEDFEKKVAAGDATSNHGSADRKRKSSNLEPSPVIQSNITEKLSPPSKRLRLCPQRKLQYKKLNETPEGPKISPSSLSSQSILSEVDTNTHSKKLPTTNQQNETSAKNVSGVIDSFLKNLDVNPNSLESPRNLDSAPKVDLAATGKQSIITDSAQRVAIAATGRQTIISRVSKHGKKKKATPPSTRRRTGSARKKMKSNKSDRNRTLSSSARFVPQNSVSESSMEYLVEINDGSDSESALSASTTQRNSKGAIENDTNMKRPAEKTKKLLNSPQQIVPDSTRPQLEDPSATKSVSNPFTKSTANSLRESTPMRVPFKDPKEDLNLNLPKIDSFIYRRPAINQNRFQSWSEMNTSTPFIARAKMHSTSTFSGPPAVPELLTSHVVRVAEEITLVTLFI